MDARQGLSEPRPPCAKGPLPTEAALPIGGCVTSSSVHISDAQTQIHTLEFRIDVGPTVINLAVFSRPYVLIREYIKVI